MSESVNRRLTKLPDLGLVIIDEAHCAIFNKFHAIFTDQLIIGFTATPKSSSKKLPMKDFYDTIICGPHIRELIKDGYLCQNITYAPKEIVDRSTLSVTGGEFNDAAMFEAFSTPRYINNTVLAYEKWAKGTKAIVFNVTTDHSKEVCKAFQDAEYPCKWLDAKSPDRTQILQWFKDTEGAILCNVGIATKGFDEPSIETVIVNKATMSLMLWLQMCGRGSRPTKTKSAFTIIDMGGNAITHGDWCDDRNWAAIFANPEKASEDGIAPVKECDSCGAIIHAGLRSCPHCGYEFPVKAIPIEEELKDFVVITKGIDVEAVMAEHANKKEYYSFFAIGRKIAKEAKAAIPKMTEEYAMFALQVYYDHAKTWVDRYRQRNKENPERKKIRFDQWHKDLAKEHLFKELKEFYPEWETESVSIQQ